MTTVTRAELVAELRTWLGTPFQLQGRVKGVGVDCAGMLIMSAQKLGLTDFDMTGYDRPRGDLMRRHMDTLMDRAKHKDLDAGDVLLFHWGHHSTHMAVLTSRTTIIHAHAGNDRVVEHGIDPRMWKLVERAYHIRGVV